MVVVISKWTTVLLFLSSSSFFCSPATLTESTVSTAFYITYFFERIHKKEPISVRVRWDAAENCDESKRDFVYIAAEYQLQGALSSD
jgi:hypothetical protein